MERKEMLQKLSEITTITANLVVTEDMGIQFDVMTSKGITTNIGNVGNWPCYKCPVTPELVHLQELVKSGKEVADEEILQVEVCKDLLSYTYIFKDKTWVVEGEKLKKCCANLKNALINLNTQQPSFYAYVDLEDWSNNDIVFFDEYEQLNQYFKDLFGDDDWLYEDMDDDYLENAIEEMEENGNGVSYKNLTDENNEEE